MNTDNAMPPTHSHHGLPPRVRLSMTTLVLSNLLPVLGVLFFGWSIGNVMILFWLENVIIGGFNVLKMLTVRNVGDRIPQAVAWPARVSMAGFFAIHYGIFTLVHGIFVMVIFGRGGLGDMGGMRRALPHMNLHVSPHNPVEGLTSMLGGWLVVPAIALIISHGISFFVNYLHGGERNRLTLQDLMAAPYGRIVVLHITIIVGGGITMAMGSPMIALLVLIGLKIAMDVQSHLREHRRAFVGDSHQPIL